MVHLIGTSDEVGSVLGTELSRYVNKRVDQFRKQLSEKDAFRIDEGRVDAFIALCEAETPHWIEEYKAVARASKVDFRTVATLNCAVPLTAIPSCTSALALGSRTPDGVPLLVKVRDERFQHQAMGYRRVPGAHGMLFSTDACNMGVGQGVNEHGLAVANNSGGLIPEKDYPIGYNDCHMTRLLLERARDTAEAVDVFKDLQARRKVGLVDGVRGMIFLMADAKGKGVILEGTPDDVEVLEADEGLFVWSNHWLLPGSKRFTPPVDPNNPLYKSSVLRYERGVELLKDKATIHIEDLKAFSSDEKNSPDSICNGTDDYPWRTVSVFVYELGPELDRPVHVAAGNPNETRFQCVPVWAEDTPEEFLHYWEA